MAPSQDQNIKGRPQAWEASMKARDVMVSPVVTVGANATVRDAAKLLIAKRISASGRRWRGEARWHRHRGRPAASSGGRNRAPRRLVVVPYFGRPRSRRRVRQVPREESQGRHDA